MSNWYYTVWENQCNYYWLGTLMLNVDKNITGKSASFNLEGNNKFLLLYIQMKLLIISVLTY